MNYKNIIFKFNFLALFLVIFSSFLLSVPVFADDCTCTSSLGVQNTNFIMTCGSSNSACILRCGEITNYMGAKVSGFVSCLSAQTNTDITGKPTTQTNITPTPQKLPNPLGITDVNALIARVINFVLSLVGSVSLLMFVYGGLTWMTSAGKSDQVKKGRDIIVWSIIGLAIVFSSYILVKFVVTSLVS